MAKRKFSVRNKPRLTRSQTMRLIKKAQSGDSAAETKLRNEYERLASMANKRLARLKKADLMGLGTDRITSYLDMLGRTKFSEGRTGTLDEKIEGIKELQIFLDKKGGTVKGAKEAIKYQADLWKNLYNDIKPDGEPLSDSEAERLARWMKGDTPSEFFGDHYGVSGEVASEAAIAFKSGVTEEELNNVLQEANAKKLLYNDVLDKIRALSHEKN